MSLLTWSSRMACRLAWTPLICSWRIWMVLESADNGGGWSGARQGQSTGEVHTSLPPAGRRKGRSTHQPPRRPLAAAPTSCHTCTAAVDAEPLMGPWWGPHSPASSGSSSRSSTSWSARQPPPPPPPPPRRLISSMLLPPSFSCSRGPSRGEIGCSAGRGSKGEATRDQRQLGPGGQTSGGRERRRRRRARPHHLLRDLLLQLLRSSCRQAVQGVALPGGAALQKAGTPGG